MFKVLDNCSKKNWVGRTSPSSPFYFDRNITADILAPLTAKASCQPHRKISQTHQIDWHFCRTEKNRNA